jgi:hypothetical protein
MCVCVCVCLCVCDLDVPRVYDDRDAIDGEGGFGDVGGHDHLARPGLAAAQCSTLECVLLLRMCSLTYLSIRSCCRAMQVREHVLMKERQDIIMQVREHVLMKVEEHILM